ncbi:hypothetical protein OH77DRAFT_1548724 [Trametes cingulata]|nr:hypothetical protein OH77DRAFT_1548724 [Trametes cingulata]
MENRLHAHSCPAEPVAYHAPAGYKSSPYKANHFNNFDPGKAGKPLAPAADLDRRLVGDSSMGSTVLVDFRTFLTEVLPPLPRGTPNTPLDKGKISQVQIKLFNKFNNVFDEKGKPIPPKEDHIAEALVEAINSLSLPGGYKAALSRHKPDKKDNSKAKVDAGLYPDGRAPAEERPDWTHCRMYIEFKKGGSTSDPWDDRDGQLPEAERSSRTRARNQLIAYAQNVFLYQHRTALLSLFIIGDEFRAMWWDRSGVIVSKKLNYVKDPAPLLKFIWHFVQLSDEQQGLDPTATLIKEDDADFKLMNDLAEPHPLDMDYLEPGTEHIVTESPLAASAAGGDASTPPSDGDALPNHHDSAPHTDAETTAPEDGWKKQPVFRYVRQQFRDSLAPDWPRYKLEVGPEKRLFLVAKPVFKSSTMFGRATRGYIAVDVQTRRFVFLKDSWRPYYVGVDPEGSYLEQFLGDEEMNVPTIICHGDVGNQVAFTARYEERLRETRKRDSLAALQQDPTASNSTRSGSSTKKRARGDDEAEAASEEISEEDSLRHHIHYRIAVEEVCLPFSEFRTTEQLIRLLYNCIETHYWAYERHKLLHRDISAGNVLILPRLVKDESGVEIVEWYGILTDWELAKRVPEGEADVARQPERTGTWQFMSVDYVACNWTRPIVVADELESFLHVLVYYAVRFLPSTLSSVTSFVVGYFDTFILDPKSGRRHCSLAKRHTVRLAQLQFMDRPVVFLKATGEGGTPLNRLIATLLRLFMARYAVIDHESRPEEAEVARGSKAVPRATPSAKPRRVDVRRGADRPWFGGYPEKSSEEHPPVLLPPRAREEAAKLDSHMHFLRLFLQALDTPEEEWRDAEVIGTDQLVNYEPRLVYVAGIDSTSGTGARKGTVKRPKTDASTGNLPSSSAGTNKLAATDPILLSSKRKGKGRAR